MRRWGVRLAVTTAFLLALAWLAPMAAARYALPQLADAFGVEVDLDGVRPAWPLGVRARRADVVYQGQPVRLEDVFLAWDRDAYTIRASLAGGRIDGRLAHSRDAALVFLDRVPLEALPLSGRAAKLALKGRVSGAVRWRGAVEVSLRAVDGSFIPSAQVPFPLPVKRFELYGWRDSEGQVRVEVLALDSPLVVARGTGDVSRRGDLQMELVVTQIEEPLRSLLSGGLEIPPGPIPFRVGGTLEQPELQLARLPQVPQF